MGGDFRVSEKQNPLVMEALCLMNMFDAQAIPESLIFNPHEDASKSLLNDKVRAVTERFRREIRVLSFTVSKVVYLTFIGW